MAVGYFWKERTFCYKRNFLAAAPTEAANSSVTLNGPEKYVCSRHDIDAIIMSLRIIVPSKSNRLNLAPLSSKNRYYSYNNNIEYRWKNTGDIPVHVKKW